MMMSEIAKLDLMLESLIKNKYNLLKDKAVIKEKIRVISAEVNDLKSKKSHINAVKASKKKITMAKMLVSGVSYTNIGAKFGTSSSAVMVTLLKWMRLSAWEEDIECSPENKGIDYVRTKAKEILESKNL